MVKSRTKEEIAFWVKLLGKPLKVYVVMHTPEDNDDHLMAICRTKSLAYRKIRQLRKEYYFSKEDLEIQEWELIV